MLKFLIATFGLFNILSLGVFAYDKRLSKREKSRISEKRLLQWSLAGPLGAVFGVFWIRHKSRKTGFLVPFVLVILISFAIYSALFWYFF